MYIYITVCLRLSIFFFTRCKEPNFSGPNMKSITKGFKK